MKDLPSNCTWWDERKDVDNFYQAADLFLFTSRGSITDKETSPLVIREAISYNIPSLIYNLPVYLGMYDKYDNITCLDFDSKENNLNKILNLLDINKKLNKFFTLQGEQDLASYEYPHSMNDTLSKYGDAAAMYWGTFLYKELDRGNIRVEKGDVFVDLGANIGMSSKYAEQCGASEIYCFEPDPTISSLLKKNVPSAKVYQNAIDSEIKDVELYHWPHNSVNIGPKYKTTTVRLKDIISLVAKKIDYLKVDIEGFEENIFDDLTSDECSKIKKMFVEHHNQEKISAFCDKLRAKGFDLIVEHGTGQSYVYATSVNITKSIYPFSARWDSNEQKMTYSCTRNLDFPIIVSLREYKSNAVMWSAEYPYFPANCEYWMVPIPKNVCDYSKSDFFSGIKFCVYKKDTQEQLYECPFFSKFVNMPTVSLSNRAPYYMNYLEYFMEEKYAKWIGKDKKFYTAVDVGANIGVFTEYLIKNKIARKIISVECDPVALEDLQKNYDVNDNVKIINKALNDTNDPIVFYQCTENSIISSTLAPSDIAHHKSGVVGSNKTEVQTVTLKDLVDEAKHIDLLKIDIEGAEYKVIENMDPSLSKYIDNMFIECHFFEADYKEKYDRLLSKLSAMGYTVDETISRSLENYTGGSECIFASKNV
jgi:hypothetical protein